MEDVTLVHVVKQDTDYLRVAKENAVGAAVVLLIGTVLPLTAKALTKTIQSKRAERRAKNQVTNN